MRQKWGHASCGVCISLRSHGRSSWVFFGWFPKHMYMFSLEILLGYSCSDKKVCILDTPLGNESEPQTREQTLGGTFLWYEKSILGCWLWVGLCCGIKGLGRLWATFEGGFFNFLWAKKKKKIFWKHCSVRTEKLHRKKVKKNIFFLGRIYFFRKTIFF